MQKPKTVKLFLLNMKEKIIVKIPKIKNPHKNIWGILMKDSKAIPTTNDTQR